MRLRSTVAVSIVLLQITLYVNLSLCQSSEGSGGSGYSGDDDGGTDMSCMLPPNLPSPPRTSRINDLLLLSRCHLACIEELVQERNLTIQVSREHAIWPSIADEVLESDCQLYQEVQECREGCVEMEKGMNDTLCSSKCFNKCRTSCNDTDSCEQTTISSCPRRCDNTNCALGCSVYQELTLDDALVPEMPRQAPELFVPEGNMEAGRYMILPGNTSLRTESSPIDLHLTSFIFRVVKVDSRVAHYWLRSLDNVLDLKAFSCSNLIIQYQAVNRYGLSVVSENADIQPVYGDLDYECSNFGIVDHLQSPDIRFGFWNHAVINVTWARPSGIQLEFLSHYHITLAPTSVGDASCISDTLNYIAHRRDTSVTIQAETPGEGLINGCSYKLTITPILSINTSPSCSVDNRWIKIQVDNEVPVNFSCDRLWNESDGQFFFDATWNIPNSSFLIGSINSFLLSTRLINGDSPQDESTSIIMFNTSVLSYNESLSPVLYHNDPEAYFIIKLKTNPNSPCKKRLMPEESICTYPSVAPSPDGVSNVRVVLDEDKTSYKHENNQFELEMNVSWSQPDGLIAGYEVRLVESESLNAEDSPGEVFASQTVDDPELSEITLVATLPEDFPNGSCIYLQVRSVSLFFSYSNWSSPECVLTLGLVIPTLTTSPPGVNQTTPTEKNSKVAMVIYPASGLGAVMIITTSMMLMIMALTCVRHKQAKESLLEAQPTLHKSLPSTSCSLSNISELEPDRIKSNSFINSSALELELHPSQILIDTRLGHGKFGDIFKGMVRGGVGLYKYRGPTSSNNVAIKPLKSTANQDEKMTFLDHIEKAKYITSMKPSKHLVSMIGFVVVHEPMCLVTELPVNGDLLTYLLASRKELLRGDEEIQVAEIEEDKTRSINPDRFSKLTGEELLRYACEIASGLEGLSSIGISHGDVACRNMFLDKQMRIKISDFSLNPTDKSRGGSRVYVSNETGRLPIKWMAPEALSEEESRLSFEADVWAFGVTLWEIVTLGGLPYNGIRNKGIFNHLREGGRLEKPENCSQEIYTNIMMQCWEDNPFERPSFSSLVQSLNAMKTSEPHHTDAISLNIPPEAAYYKVISHSRRRLSEGRSHSYQSEYEVEVVNEDPPMSFQEVSEEIDSMVVNLIAGKSSGYLPKIDEEMEEEVEQELHSNSLHDTTSDIARDTITTTYAHTESNRDNQTLSEAEGELSLGGEDEGIASSSSSGEITTTDTLCSEDASYRSTEDTCSHSSEESRDGVTLNCHESIVKKHNVLYSDSQSAPEDVTSKKPHEMLVISNYQYDESLDNLEYDNSIGYQSLQNVSDDKLNREIS